MVTGTWIERSCSSRADLRDVASQIQNKELWETTEASRKQRKGNSVCKEKQESADDRRKQTLQFLSLGGLAVLCILFLDINQSACDLHPITPVHVDFSVHAATRAPDHNRHGRTIHKKRIKRSELNMWKIGSCKQVKALRLTFSAIKQMCKDKKAMR